jgi:MFS family permease
MPQQGTVSSAQRSWGRGGSCDESGLQQTCGTGPVCLGVITVSEFERTEVAEARTSWVSWYALAVLTIVTLFAFVDRQVLVLLAEEIRIALDLSDFQLGLLQGTGIALFTGLAIYPIAWLADRFDRRLVLAGSIVAWSLAVVGCGFAQTYPQMLLASAMVGAGEAGLAPLVFAAIPDLFDRKTRQLANSIFAVAGTTTGALAMVLGGQLIAGADSLRAALPADLQMLETWRVSFLLAALPAPLMVLLVLTVPLNRNPPRPAARRVQTGQPAGPTFIGFVKGRAAPLAKLYGAFGMANFGYQALLAWIVVICMRSYGQTPAQVGAAIGVANLVAVPLAFVASILLSRWLLPRIGPVFPFRAIWIGYALSAVVLGSLALADSVLVLYFMIGVGYAINGTTGMLLPTGLQNLAPPPLRARFVAVNGVVNLALASLAPPIVGLLSDHYGDLHPNGLLLSALAVCVPALVGAALLLRSGERRFAAIMHESLAGEERNAAVPQAASA